MIIAGVIGLIIGLISGAAWGFSYAERQHDAPIPDFEEEHRQKIIAGGAEWTLM